MTPSAISITVLGGPDAGKSNYIGALWMRLRRNKSEFRVPLDAPNITYVERIVEDDVRASAIVIAATAYELAMRDDLLPRFDRYTMPSGSWR